MTTVHHTAITTGAAANAATINAPLGQLDTKLGAAKTSGHIIYADASGNLSGVATLYRHPTSGNIIIGDATPVDITNAVLQVAGNIVISDGAGGTSASFSSTVSKIPAQHTIATALYADDGFDEFTPAYPTGMILISGGVTPSTNIIGLFSSYSNATGIFYQPGSDWVVFSSTDITSAGTDGKLNLSMYGGKIQIRNRSGGGIYLTIQILLSGS